MTSVVRVLFAGAPLCLRLPFSAPAPCLRRFEIGAVRGIIDAAALPGPASNEIRAPQPIIRQLAQA